MPAQAAHRARGADSLKNLEFKPKGLQKHLKHKRAFIIPVPSPGLSFPGSVH